MKVLVRIILCAGALVAAGCATTSEKIRDPEAVLNAVPAAASMVSLTIQSLERNRDRYLEEHLELTGVCFVTEGNALKATPSPRFGGKYFSLGLTTGSEAVGELFLTAQDLASWEAVGGANKITLVDVIAHRGPSLGTIDFRPGPNFRVTVEQ